MISFKPLVLVAALMCALAPHDALARRNLAQVQQLGSNNAAAVVQNGAANDAQIDQRGNGNAGAITQTGSYNRACLFQIGNGLNGSVAQNGDGQRAVVVQTGRYTRVGQDRVIISRGGAYRCR